MTTPTAERLLQEPTVIRARFLNHVAEEIKQASAQYAPMNSLHEGYAVILEELDELWDECRKKHCDRNRYRIYRELVQIAAMACRTATDLGYTTFCDGEDAI